MLSGNAFHSFPRRCKLLGSGLEEGKLLLPGESADGPTGPSGEPPGPKEPTPPGTAGRLPESNIHL